MKKKNNFLIYFVNIAQIKPILIGGFHGLSDSVEDVPIFLKKFYKKKIYDSLKNLDHIFFFGDADRENAIKMFNGVLQT